MSLVEDLLSLQKKCYECQKCPLGKRTVDDQDPHVFASGKPTSTIMFVGEAPGYDETVKRVPLIGAAGRFFESRILAPIGLTRDDVYITNSVLCRPNEKNRTPFLGEVEECLEFLDSQILLVSPKLIVSLGNIPLYACCEEQKVTKKRGTLLWSRTWSDGKRIPVFPMLHPAYCLRGSGLEEMEQDVEYLKSLIEDVKAERTIL